MTGQIATGLNGDIWSFWMRPNIHLCKFVASVPSKINLEFWPSDWFGNDKQKWMQKAPVILIPPKRSAGGRRTPRRFAVCQ